MENNLKGKIEDLFYKVESMGLFEKYEQPIVDENKTDFIRVAAGDPTLDTYLNDWEQTFYNVDNLPEDIKTQNDRKSFVIDGFSMLPEGINNGDVLVSIPVNWHAKENFKEGKFVVIEVDPEYYRHKNKKMQFRYKLRKTLAFVSKEDDAEKIIAELKKNNDDILLVENQKNLKEKLLDARKYEEYSNIDLVLSVTYRNGSLRYSFHPITLVKYIGRYCAKKGMQESWTFEDLEKWRRS